MQRSIHLTLAVVLFAVLLPGTLWGNPPYAESAGGNHYSNSLRLQKSMNEDGYFLRAYLDGLRPEDIQISLRRNHLVLQVSQGERYGPNNSRGGGVSRWQMRFRRQLRLPYDADASRMTANTNNGIMEIYIPRRHQHMQTNPSPRR